MTMNEIRAMSDRELLTAICNIHMDIGYDLHAGTFEMNGEKHQQALDMRVEMRHRLAAKSEG